MRSAYTFGVEEEYQLVDPRTWEMASRADEILELDWANRIQGELQETMLEVDTPVCRDADQLGEVVRQLRLHAATAAAAEDLQIVSAGTHPFSRWEDHRTADTDRPKMLLQQMGLLMREEQWFGLHVHVHVPDEDDRIRVLGAVRRYVPHLLALSTSSPFLEGHDTGYVSYRTILNRRVPLAGPPPRLPDRAAYERLLGAILGAGAVPDARTLYWDVRPNARHPTVEFRVADACPRVEDAVAIAVLARALVAAVLEAALPAHGNDETELVLLGLNHWLVARAGLDALLVDVARPEGVPVRDELRALVEVLRPVSRQLGDADALDHVHTILERGTAADELRTRHAQGASGPTLVEWLNGETLRGVGLDRRSRQREDDR